MTFTISTVLFLLLMPGKEKVCSDLQRPQDGGHRKLHLQNSKNRTRTIYSSLSDCEKSSRPSSNIPHNCSLHLYNTRHWRCNSVNCVLYYTLFSNKVLQPAQHIWNSSELSAHAVSPHPSVRSAAVRWGLPVLLQQMEEKNQHFSLS
ncbi:uncharacterized protein [Hoplias malabaricus]|uniref:uncharacterized protein isoform X2 n=1 Tax=Hoplias malabaricus TaxID=27720 RepID=UPI003462916B